MTTKKLKPSRSKSSQFKTTTGDQKRVKTDVVKRTVNKPSATAPGSKKLLPGSALTNTGIFLLLVIGTAALYSGDLHLDFFRIDDKQYVVNNPWITSFTAENIGYILSTPYFTNYSPLHLFSYMLDYSFNGADPYIFHLSSNIWAGMVAGMVFLTALALTGRHLIAIAAAVLFVVHPAHVEAIAWISSRKDLVATAFALPSILCYLTYSKGGYTSTKWYLLSLLFFTLALAGKVSVATLPAVFLALDLFLERRPFVKSLVNKTPFLLITAAFAIIVYSAQPLSGNNLSPYVLLSALLQSIWLLTGFGEYVIYRLRLEDVPLGLEIVGLFLLILLFSAPLLLRKKFPLLTVLVYWMLFGLLPAQLLSFVHPVTDRYLFFPSIAVVILIAWGLTSTIEKLRIKPLVPAAFISAIIGFFWVKATVSYLAEWKDPRSVWYAAIDKSSDPDVPYSLGGHYIDVAGRLGNTPRGTRLTNVELKQLASAIWPQDNRLQPLFSEWDKSQTGGPMEKSFQNYLWDQAWAMFEQALQTRGTHVLPNLYYKRGLLLMDRGQLKEARKEFLIAADEASLSSVKETREDLTVNSHNALGAISWREGNYKEALKWFKMAEEEQANFGGSWVPGISETRKQMENMVAMMSGKSISGDAKAAYNIGLYYFDAAGQLGTTPRVKFSLEFSENIANQIWAGNPQLPALKDEWRNGVHGGKAEINYKNYLRELAWNAFEQAAKNKEDLILPNLYFRRGMLLGETGKLAEARKEFLTVLKEVAREKDEKEKQEFLVTTHDALGVLAWTSKNYSEALQWFRQAEEEQIRFGGAWVSDISQKRKQMETLAAAAH